MCRGDRKWSVIEYTYLVYFLPPSPSLFLLLLHSIVFHIEHSFEYLFTTCRRLTKKAHWSYITSINRSMRWGQIYLITGALFHYRCVRWRFWLLFVLFKCAVWVINRSKTRWCDERSHAFQHLRIYSYEWGFFHDKTMNTKKNWQKVNESVWQLRCNEILNMGFAIFIDILPVFNACKQRRNFASQSQWDRVNCCWLHRPRLHSPKWSCGLKREERAKGG